MSFNTVVVVLNDVDDANDDDVISASDGYGAIVLFKILKRFVDKAGDVVIVDAAAAVKFAKIILAICDVDADNVDGDANDDNAVGVVTSVIVE
jgi:hypothetical protein